MHFCMDDEVMLFISALPFIGVGMRMLRSRSKIYWHNVRSVLQKGRLGRHAERD